MCSDSVSLQLASFLSSPKGISNSLHNEKLFLSSVYLQSLWWLNPNYGHTPNSHHRWVLESAACELPETLYMQWCHYHTRWPWAETNQHQPTPSLQKYIHMWRDSWHVTWQASTNRMRWCQVILISFYYFHGTLWTAYLVLHIVRVDYVSVVTSRSGGWYGIYTTKRQRLEDSVNPLPTDWSGATYLYYGSRL